MKRIAKILLMVINICPYIVSQQILQPAYHSANFAFTPPGANKFGLYGYDNPAILTYLHQPDIYFTWTDLNSDSNDVDNWGLFTAIPNLGFSVVSYGGKNHSVTDYSLSAAFGGQVFSLGLGYSWISGESDLFQLSNKITVGSLFRFNRYFSLGLVANLPNEGEKTGIIDLAVRPFGTQRLTLFGDYILTDQQAVKDIKWSAGAVLEPLDGIRFTGRFFEGKSFNIGTQISFGNFGI
ncbi:MAG TPA: hypothetical protein VK870_01385, partial [Ignavibacteriaceae bacterium]|nr:hypothetical protein [Ignavibacteriaceae bacterium]